MSNVYKTIYDTLATLGYPVREQGAYAPDEILPETHITYQLVEDADAAHYDNIPAGKSSRIQLTLYSKDPAVKQSADSTLRSVLVPAGFMRVSGRDLPYEKETGHYAYTSDYRYYESEA